MNLKGDDDEKLVKVANVRKDNYNINIMENFPMDIEIGPKVETIEPIARQQCNSWKIYQNLNDPVIAIILSDGSPVPLFGDRRCARDQCSTEWAVWIRKDLVAPRGFLLCKSLKS